MPDGTQAAVTAMTEPDAAPPPIAIDRVERARGKGDEVRLRLSGRWLGPGDPAAHDPLLVIQRDGRRHRFAADRSASGRDAESGGWRAEFSIPAWAVPDRAGQAALWVGSSVVAIGPPGSPPPVGAPPPVGGPPPVGAGAPVGGPPPVGAGAPVGGPSPVGAPPSVGAPPVGAPPGDPHFPGEPEPVALPAAEAPRSGPLADLLFKETVSALHAELERRTQETAQLRGALADARSELEARAARQAGLESAHAQLREELARLTDAVARQREEHEARVGTMRDELERAREQAAMTGAARDDALGELSRVREEAGGLSDRLHALSERLAAQTEAERRAAEEAAALREQVAAANISRDAAVSEAGGLRVELERLGAELTVVREQLAAQGGDLGEAQRLLADARALTDQLRGPGDG